MAMFGSSGRETYDAFYTVLSKDPDVTALEREAAPGAFAGDLGAAAGRGAVSAGRRAELGAVGAAAATGGLPAQAEMFGIGRELEAGVYGEPARQSVEDMRAALRSRQTDVARMIKDLRPDPKTNGMAAQLLFGLTDVLGTVALAGGNPYATGGLFGYTQAQVGMAEGLDPLTAYAKGAIEGTAMGVSVALPAALTGSLAYRMASGAALNVSIGIPERFAVSTLLNARGFSEMARQYQPLDATAIATEVVLGAAFGGLLGPRVRPAVPKPDAIPPSAVDAALTANEVTHAEIHTAPGVPVDTRSRQAHNAALDQAVESIVMGRDVNVESLLTAAGFLGKRPDFDALRIIAEELDKAGAADVVAKVRALEAEARSRGLVVDEDTLGSVVLSDKPVETTVAGAAVRESKVRVGEEYVPTRLMLVEAREVQATMEKAANQFRDRTRVASEQQIADIAARLDPALLGDAPVMDYGAPVLAADGTVIGGNGRAAAIARAYDQGTAQQYRDVLRADFGDAVDGMQAPMLVRVLQRDVDVAKAAILSNEGGALRMSALEQAKVDAERLGDFRAFEFNEDGDLNLAGNMPFIREWVGQMPQNQRAAIMDADGRLSAEGAGRLRNAILFRAYGDSPTLARLVEATDPGSRNIAGAMTRAAPAVADAREAIERGDLFPMGLHDDLIAAVEKLDALRRAGMSVDDWSKQIDAFGDGMTPEARLLVQFMDRNIRASRVISDGIFGFYNRLLEAGSPKQGSMFEASQPDKGRMLSLALDDGGAPMYSRSLTETPEFRGWFGDSKVVDADGSPLIVYHGSDRLITTFDFEKIGQNFGRKPQDQGFWFTADKDQSIEYASNIDGTRAGKVANPFFLSIKNPAVWGDSPDNRPLLGPFVLAAKKAGHDGVIFRGLDDGTGIVADQFLVFRQEQIKSPLNRGTFNPADPSTMLSRGAGRGVSAADLTTAFRAMFGRDADRLIETGRVRIVQSVRDLPGSGHPADVGGMYWRGEAWIVADNTGLSQIRGRVLHEVGEHAGMQQMLGDALYRQVLDTVASKAETDPVFQEARALAEARANRPEHVPAETLAYLVENAPELPLVRRILAAVRQWVYRTTGGRFVDLTQADLQMMAVASLRRYAREAEIAAKGEDAPWYMTLFHGTPSVFKPEPGAPLGALRWKYINTGEGAQAFGYGHYLAQQEWIARTRYRDRLVKRRKPEPLVIERAPLSWDETTREGQPPIYSAYFPGGGMFAEGQVKISQAAGFPWRVDFAGGGSRGGFATADEAKAFVQGEAKPLTITDDDDAAWRIGDRVVHESMGGEEAGLAAAAAQVAMYGYVRARDTFEALLPDAREQAARFERGFRAVKVDGGWNVEAPTGKDMMYRTALDSEVEAREAAENFNEGFYRGSNRDGGRGLKQQAIDKLNRIEGALRALDDLTIEADPTIKKTQFRGRDAYVVNNQGNGFPTLEEAQAYAATVGKRRVLRPDIQELRPQPPKGAIYGKVIPDEQWARMMIWDAPLSAQPDNVREAFAKFGINDEPLNWKPDSVRAKQLGFTDRWSALAEPGVLVEIHMHSGTWNRYLVIVNGKSMFWENSLEEAKETANFRYGSLGTTGEGAYRQLKNMFEEEDGGGPLADFAMEADMEIKRRRAPEGTDPMEFNAEYNSEESASVILHLLGIPGHRFLDGETRAKGWDSPDARFNVVLYSDDFGRVAWEGKSEPGQQPTEWVTANGRGRVVRELSDPDPTYADTTYSVYVDGNKVGAFDTLEKSTRAAEDALGGALYSRGDTMRADPLEDTTLPDARLLSEQADAEIATAKELSQGFLPAVECALVVGA